MFTEEDGDSLVGRTVAQLKFNADEFDVLPPHFNHITLQELHAFGWERILPTYNCYPSSFQRICPYLLASLMYHYKNGNLNKILPNNHPLFQSNLFRLHDSLVQSLGEKVLFCHGECLDTHMTAQGVPGFIVVSREVRRVQKFMESRCQLLEEKYTEMGNNIKEIIELLPTQIIDLLLEKIRVEGVQPVTLESIQALMMSILSSENSPLHRMSLQITNLSQALNASGHTTVTVGDTNTSRRVTMGDYHTWTSDPERMHLVPFGFRWPTGMNTKVIWDFWFFGNSHPDKRIVAYRRIEPKFELTTDHCKVEHTKAKRVIEKLLKILVDDEKISTYKDINESNSQGLFEYSYSKLLVLAYGQEGKDRPGDLILGTVYERLRRYKLLK